MRPSLHPCLHADSSARSPVRLVPVVPLPMVPMTARPAPQPSMHFARILHSKSDRPSLSGPQRIREALLLTFCDPIPRECLRLWLFTRGDWSRALHWLDISGLALYFLDRIEQLDLYDILPPAVLARLRQNLADNTNRTASMMEEWIEIQRSFYTAGLSWATLKGFSLYPQSVPRPQLRSQLDIDFLIAESSAPAARSILESRGYRLHAISGRSWEFKRSAPTRITLDDLYKPTPHRSAELHLESSDSPSPLLDRLEGRNFQGQSLPVLAPLDLFLGQGLHLYKHIVSECTRAAHLLEFRRHVLTRYDDTAFWRDLQHLAEADPRAPIGLGVATLLITRLMGPFAPLAFTSWTVDRVPPAARLWIDTYGHDFVLGDFPGTKLYLLLQQALAPAGINAKRSRRAALLPKKLPPAIMHATPGECFLARLRRNWTQFRFISIRARFHAFQGLRYLYESRRWHKLLAQSGGSSQPTGH